MRNFLKVFSVKYFKKLTLDSVNYQSNCDREPVTKYARDFYMRSTFYD